MSIQEHLNKIRNAVYGREVRESIAKGIETAYDDASENGNANMEVKIARGTHPNLRSRLEEVDNKQQQTTAQLAQKANVSDLEVEKQRINNLIDLPDGSTTGDAQLSDLRVGSDGVLYDTPGDAVRENDKRLATSIATVSETLTRSDMAWERGGISVSSGENQGSSSHNNRVRTSPILLENGGLVKLTTANPDIRFRVYEYDENGNYIVSSELQNNDYRVTNKRRIRLAMQYLDSREINDAEIEDLTGLLFISVKPVKVNNLSDLSEGIRKRLGIHEVNGTSLDWVSRSLDSQGKDGSDDSTIIRSGFIDLPMGTTIMLNDSSDCKLNIFLYHSDTLDYVKTFPTSNLNMNTKSSFTLDDNYTVRVVMVYDDRRTVTQIEDLSKRLTILTTPTQNQYEISVEWVLGTLGLAEGGLSSSTTRVRTDFIKFPDSAYVSLKSNGLRIRPYYYDANDEFLYVNQPVSRSLYIPSGSNVRFILYYEDDREIEDVEALTNEVVITIPDRVRIEKAEEEVEVQPETASKYMLSGELSGYYEGYDPMTFEDTPGIQHSDIYNAYDELVTQYPHYVKKFDRGLVESDLPMYYYTFTPKEEDVHYDNPKPKVIITSGIHGDEKTPPVATLSFFQKLCSDWRDDNVLEFLRNNVEFIVIPVASPESFNTNTRETLEGHNPNRTYAVETLDPNDSPLHSTRTIMGILEEHSDAEILIDYHNFYWGEGEIAYAFVDGEVTTRAIYNSVTKVAVEWQKKYDFMPQEEDMRLTFTQPTIGGMLSRYATVKGMQSVVLETPRALRYYDTAYYSDMSILFGEELLVNSVKGLLKTLNIVTT